jgi:hypothetical protein
MNSSRTIALALVALLAVLHQDFWLWDDPTLVFGVLPAGLAWHTGISIGAAVAWAGVAAFAWPVDPFEGEEGS